MAVGVTIMRVWPVMGMSVNGAIAVAVTLGSEFLVGQRTSVGHRANLASQGASPSREKHSREAGVPASSTSLATRGPDPAVGSADSGLKTRDARPKWTLGLPV